MISFVRISRQCIEAGWQGTFIPKSVNFAQILDIRNARREVLFRDDVTLLRPTEKLSAHMIHFDNFLVLTSKTSQPLEYLVILEVSTLYTSANDRPFRYRS